MPSVYDYLNQLGGAAQGAGNYAAAMAQSLYQPYLDYAQRFTGAPGPASANQSGINAAPAGPAHAPAPGYGAPPPILTAPDSTLAPLPGAPTSDQPQGMPSPWQRGFGRTGTFGFGRGG